MEVKNILPSILVVRKKNQDCCEKNKNALPCIIKLFIILQESLFILKQNLNKTESLKNWLANGKKTLLQARNLHNKQVNALRELKQI
jgi:dsDNA-binding SOS-regulon protein